MLWMVLLLLREALVGQALGARNRLMFRKSAIMTSQWGFGSVVLMAIIFAVFGSNIIDSHDHRSRCKDS